MGTLSFRARICESSNLENTTTMDGTKIDRETWHDSLLEVQEFYSIAYNSKSVYSYSFAGAVQFSSIWKTWQGGHTSEMDLNSTFLPGLQYIIYPRKHEHWLRSSFFKTMIFRCWDGNFQATEAPGSTRWSAGFRMVNIIILPAIVAVASLWKNHCHQQQLFADSLWIYNRWLGMFWDCGVTTYQLHPHPLDCFSQGNIYTKTMVFAINSMDFSMVFQ